MNGRMIRRASGQDEDNPGPFPSQGSSGSYFSHFFTDRFSPSTSSNYLDEEEVDNGSDSDSHHLQRQRSSSISVRVRNAGGVNSIDNFARSWQRAAAFPEVLPRRSSFAPGEMERPWLGESGDDGTSKDREPLLGHASPLTTGDDGEERAVRDDSPGIQSSSGRHFHAHLGPDIYVASSAGRSFGTSYGTLNSRMSESVRHNVMQLHDERQRTLTIARTSSQEPLLIKEVEQEDGTKASVVVGQSTMPQTIFNSVNVLIGVGLLSLPLGMKYAGWIPGLLFLFFSAAVTAYTARVLARCLDVDPNLVTYADLAYISFGPQARIVTSILFCLELVGACVALVVLFADSLDALIPGPGLLNWKIICGIILMPLNFVPLRFLSITSVLGILSCSAIVIIIFIDGLIKPDAPGSLRDPGHTSLFPDSWATLPLSLGLIMSPWGGHGVFPNIYRDMRHPVKYDHSLIYTYSFTFSLDCAMAVIGWLMFGESVRDEITANVLLTSKYPRGLLISMIIFIAIIPITKVPLNCRPLVATMEVLGGLNPQSNAPSQDSSGIRRFGYHFAKAFVRVFIIVIIVFIAIIFPSFDRIMALVGSCLCFTICIIFPLAFYLKIFGEEISFGEKVADWILIVVSTVMAVVGTVWAFLPKESL